MTGPGFGQTSLFPPEPAPDPLLCWLWLANTLGAGSSHAGRVLDVFGGAQEAWENRDSDAFRKAVGSPAFARANLPDNTPAYYRAFARRCAARNIRILPYDDPDYPLAFSRIPDMPLVLYCTGDPLWLNEPGAVGMVGSRRPTEYGLQAAADLGSGLAKNGAIIVSGLADGLDSAGHRAAVKENCPTIGVLGVPIDRTYPASNRELRKKIEQKGCVISEYPPESGPVGPNGFLQRNRLIAALSSALVVVEAQEKSGTMSTVNHAERYGKPVFVVPGSIYSPNSAGTNALLREGRAKAVCKPGDLFGVLGLRGAAAPAAVRSAPDPMSETERRVLACIGPKAKGVEELGVTYLGCFLHRAYFRWVDDGRPEEMFSDLASQAQEARCVRSAQIFAAALCALGAAMQFYTAWEYLYAAQIYEELYAELIAAGGPSVVAAWMPRIALEAVLGLSWLALAVWGASAAVRTHKKWKKIKDEQCICE